MAFAITRRARGTQAPPDTTSDPDAQVSAAQTALDSVNNDLAAVRQQLADYQAERDQLLRTAGDVEKIAEIDRATYRLRLHETQLDLKLPNLQLELQRAQLTKHEAAWIAYRGNISDAERRLAASIEELYAALEALHRSHMSAHSRGFGGWLAGYLPVPPGATPGSIVQDWPIRNFLKIYNSRNNTAEAA